RPPLRRCSREIAARSVSSSSSYSLVTGQDKQCIPDRIRIQQQETDMLSRRTVLNSFVAGGASELLAGSQPAEAQPTVRRFRIWDAHSHLHSAPGDTPEARMEVLVRCADRLGIERIIMSQGYSADLHPTREQLREENDRVLRAVRRFPDQAYGSV